MRTRALMTLVTVLAVAGCKEKKDEPADDSRQVDTPSATAPEKETPRPRLVVLIVVDQLPSWSFERDEELMRAGIRRLIDGGVLYRRARYPFANTYTATGHATLGTGAPPGTSGILGNSWYRRDRKEIVSATADADAPLLQIPGMKEADPNGGASPRQLRAEGIADVLERETGGAAKTVAISIKARGAVMMLGKRPDIAVWYDAKQPAMTTSRYFAEEPPDWLAQLAAQHPVTNHFGDVWEPEDAELLARVTGVKDEMPGEDGPYGLDATFPHRVDQGGRPQKALRATPAGNEIILETALAAIEGEALGADDVPDLLAVSFSPHDYAGHYWGQESWERLEILLDTDRAIGALLDVLDQRVGKGRYAVVLSSDHGVTRLVEHSKAAGKNARRILLGEVVAAAEEAAAGVLGEGDWVEATSVLNLYLASKLMALPEDEREAAMEAIVGAVAKVPSIAFAASTEKLAGDCEQREGVEELACRSLHPTDSGEIFFAPEPDCVCTSAKYTSGTTHGSPNPDDTDVPVVVYGPGVVPRATGEVVSMLRVAPTLAALLGVSPPAQAEGLPLR